MAVSRHDSKIVDWDVKAQTKQKTTTLSVHRWPVPQASNKTAVKTDKSYTYQSVNYYHLSNRRMHCSLIICTYDPKIVIPQL